jgi:hypothetical protein
MFHSTNTTVVQIDVETTISGLPIPFDFLHPHYLAAEVTTIGKRKMMVGDVASTELPVKYYKVFVS